MDEQTAVLIEKLASAIEGNGEYVVATYAKWHLVSAIGWSIVGVFLLFVSFFLPKITIEDYEYEAFINLVIKGAIFFLGLLFIFFNLPDLFNPEAIGIHQLIIDIRGCG
jgi:hypothetical protein